MISGTHDLWLVALSVIVAISASYTALDLASRLRGASGRARYAWLLAAAIAMGGGIWSMHFVAMLAFVMPMPISYDVALTVASLVLPIIVTAAAFAIVSRRPRNMLALAGSGLVMGTGIVLMHYMGMAAMRMSATVSYERFWVAVSILVAIGAATLALWLAGRNTRFPVRAAASVVMGFAVAGMHYVAMVAATFAGGHIDHAQGEASFSQTNLALGVAGLTFFILFLGWAAALFDRRLAAAEVTAAQTREDRLRDLYRRTPLPLFSLDASNAIDQVSDDLVRLLGYDRSELEGRRIDAFLDLPHQDFETEGELTAERQVRTKTGDVLDVRVSIRSQRDQEGVLRRLGGVVDMTATRRAEAELRQAQKLEAIGQLTGGVAHDFNNLLTIIRSSTDLLRKKDLDEERRRKYLDAISDTVDLASKLTNQLLAFARRQALKPEVFAPAERIGTISQMLSSLVGSRIEVVTDFDCPECFIEADPNQFEAALVNIAVNARDAMGGEGRLVLSIAETTEMPAIRGKSASQGPFVAITVSDSGCGIPAENLDAIFEPFFTTKEIGRGTGLGLSQVYGFVQQSGGNIAVESEVGRGTSFTLYLPKAEVGKRPEQRVERRRDAALHPGDARRVLVVEDNEGVGTFSTQLLRDLGYVPTLARSAEEALAHLSAGKRFDVIFSDVVMPGMGGVELARQIRGQFPGLPILLTSGYSEALADEGSGGFELLQKPYAAEELSKKLRRVLSRTGNGTSRPD